MTWDKSKPAGSQKIRLSDDEIRANWAALEDALGRDHNFPGTEGVDAGEHNWVTLREQSGKPSLGTGKHALYAKSDGVYIEKEDGTEIKVFDFASERLVNGDIPSGEIILFEKDTAVVGYTLLTDKDDMVIYVTKGSAAGGETGATDKSGGTWTVGGLSTASVSVTHNHQWFANPGSYHSDGSWNNNFQEVVNTDKERFLIRAGNNVGRIGEALWTANASCTHSHGVNSNASWRPPGRNFTRQQRN